MGKIFYLSHLQMVILLPATAAAAAAKSLQSCPTLCDPRDSSPPGSPVPGILQARILEWVAISFSNVLGASVRNSTRGKGHEEGGSASAKAGSSLRSPPGYSRASTPQNQSLPTLLLCALTSDFMRAVPHHHLTVSEKELTYSSS